MKRLLEAIVIGTVIGLAVVLVLILLDEIDRDARNFR